MVIDIVPADVVRSAGLIGAAAEHLAGGGAPTAPGNSGFLLSEAINRFSAEMHQTTTTSASHTNTAAERIEATARLMRDVDDHSAQASAAVQNLLGGAGR